VPAKIAGAVTHHQGQFPKGLASFLTTSLFLSGFPIGGSILARTHMADDHQLLRRYATEGSDAAFGELVARHVNLVYSAALLE
jgi:hypothetical protein